MAPSACGLDTDQAEPGGADQRLQIRAKKAQVAGIGLEQPLVQIEQRHIMVARQGQHLRYGQTVAEGPGLRKLRGVGALCDVTRQYQYIGPLRSRQRLQRLHHGCLHRTEVRVGNLQ